MSLRCGDPCKLLLSWIAQVGPRNALGASQNWPGRVLTTGFKNGTHKLPAERLVLFFEPTECVLKMLRMKIWPIFIPDI